MNIFKKKVEKSKKCIKQINLDNKNKTKENIKKSDIVSEKEIDSILLDLHFEEINHIYQGCQIKDCKYCISHY